MPSKKLSELIYISFLVLFLAIPILIIDSSTNHSFAQGNSGNGNGNGGGNSGGNGGGNSGGNSSGNSDSNTKSNNSNQNVAKDNSTPSFNSVMKGLNAYKANKNAFENANSNSQVGRIASYVDAIAVRKSSFSNLLEVQKKKDDFLSSYEGRNSEEIETDITNVTEALNSLTFEIQQIQSQLNELDQESESYSSDLESLNAQLTALDEAQQTNITSLETLENELEASIEFNNGLASLEQEVDVANTAYQDAINIAENALNESTGNQNLSAEEVQQIENIISTLE